MSTEPSLRHVSIIEYINEVEDAYCFSGGRFLVIASGGWIGSYSALHGNISIRGNDKLLFEDVRRVLARILQDNLGTT